MSGAHQDGATTRWVWRRFDVQGPPPPLTATVALTRALRAAILAHAPELPAELSGHDPAGGPLAAGHVGFLAVPPNIGSDRIGALVAASPGIEPAPLARAVEAWSLAAPAADGGGLPLVAGPAGRHVLVPRDPAAPPSPWSDEARRWTSVTPVALDRHPRHLRHRDPVRRAEAHARVVGCLADACERTTGIRPAAIRWWRTRGRGSVPARAFPAFPPEGGHGPRRVLVHATVEFPRPVRGPLLLGAGRYFGLGLFRPH